MREVYKARTAEYEGGVGEKHIGITLRSGSNA
jgi:hypothetical protein